MSNSKHDYSYMQNRELSWLDFNKRVLDQSADNTVPLFEKLNFLSIFWSNLQEFFMIRVGSLRDLALLKKEIVDSKSGMTPSEQLDAIYKRCHELYPYYEQCYKNLRKELTHHGILNIRHKGLASDQLDYIEDYFEANIMPFLSPQIVNSRHPFPHLENGALYVVVRLDEEAAKNKDKKKNKEDAEARAEHAVKAEKQSKSSKNVAAEGVTLGIIPMPKQCPRIIRIPGPGFQFMLLEHLIERFVNRIFSMYKVKHTNVICVTRNADLDATEGAEEQGEDYREHIKKILKKRMRLAPVRLESERELSNTVKRVLLERLNLKSYQTFVSSVPLDMSYVFELPSLVTPEVREELTLTPFTPQWPASLDRNRSIIEQVSKRDILLSYPYESMDAFVQLLREASVDPDVVAIKITLYRLAKQSHIAEALITAAEHGKEVTAVFELRARFDEANNIEWSQRFEAAGCNVLYGFRDYKVHSKVCLIVRRQGDGHQLITQLGTGNYNEKTAKLYTDFSFMTTDKHIGRDVAAFFRNMTLENLSDEYRSIWVAPLQIKQSICSKIDKQIVNARAGKPAALFFKTNSITDKDVIDKIVEASQAGVQCTLFVRGISCIVPGIAGYTENVCVVSIVGRLLEHSRIYVFGPFDGDCEIYLSSADLMTRNMDKRVEIAWPITNEVIQEKIVGYIGTCMADTAKLRDLLPNHKYTELGFFARRDKTGRMRLFDSQNYLIHEAERNLFEDSEGMHAAQIDDIDQLRTSAFDEMDLSRMGEEVTEFENIAEISRARMGKDKSASSRRKASRGSRESVSDVVRKDVDHSIDAIEREISRDTSKVRSAIVASNDIEDEERRDALHEVMPWKDENRSQELHAYDDYAFYDDASDSDQIASDSDQIASDSDQTKSKTDDGIDLDVLLEGMQSSIPNISNLYTPEPNPDGIFEIPVVSDGQVSSTSHIERAGGPVPVVALDLEAEGAYSDDVDVDSDVDVNANVDFDAIDEDIAGSDIASADVLNLDTTSADVADPDVTSLNIDISDSEVEVSDAADGIVDDFDLTDAIDEDVTVTSAESTDYDEISYLNSGMVDEQDLIDQYADSLAQQHEAKLEDEAQLMDGAYYQGYGTNGHIDEGFGSSDDENWIYTEQENGAVQDGFDMQSAEAAQSDIIQPDIIQPDIIQTDAVQAGIVPTDAVQGDIIQTDVIQTDVVPTEVVQPEAIETEYGVEREELSSLGADQSEVDMVSETNLMETYPEEAPVSETYSGEMFGITDTTTSFTDHSNYEVDYPQVQYDLNHSDSISMSSQFGFGEYVDDVQSQVQVEPAVSTEVEEEINFTDERGLGSEWKGPDGAVPADEMVWPAQVNAALSGKLSHDLSGLDISTSGEIPSIDGAQSSAQISNPMDPFSVLGENAPVGNSVNPVASGSWQAAEDAIQQEAADVAAAASAQAHAAYESVQEVVQEQMPDQAQEEPKKGFFKRLFG